MTCPRPSGYPTPACRKPLRRAAGFFVFSLKQAKEPFFESSLAAFELLIKGFRSGIDFLRHLHQPRFTLVRPLRKAPLAFVVGQIQVLRIRFFDPIFCR